MPPASFRIPQYSISEGLHYVDATLLLISRSGTAFMLGKSICLADMMPNLMMCFTHCIMGMQAGCFNSIAATLMASCILCLGSGQTIAKVVIFEVSHSDAIASSYKSCAARVQTQTV